MAENRSLVIVAGPDPTPTDSLADLMRETATVRTAYSTDDVLDRLDDEVDVVLVDPSLSTDAVSTVHKAVTQRDLDCQIGLLPSDGTRGDAVEIVDSVVPLTAGDERVRETVEWLALRAQYRRTLEEYYELVQRAADLKRFDDRSEVAPDLERLERQIEQLRRRLDETAEQLDTVSLFEAALHRDSEE